MAWFNLKEETTKKEKFLKMNFNLYSAAFFLQGRGMIQAIIWISESDYR